MNKFTCYILQSEILNRFYIGATILDPLDRLEKHLSLYYGNRKFTANADDWEIFIEISCSSIEQARKIEKHVKEMKSKEYILNLKKYPEIIEKLKSKYA